MRGLEIVRGVRSKVTIRTVSRMWCNMRRRNKLQNIYFEPCSLMWHLFLMTRIIIISVLTIDQV